MNARRDRSMMWVVGAAVMVSLLALLPVLYSVTTLHSDKLGILWGYAPNQFLFLLVPFPLAAFTAFIGLRYVLVTLEGEKIHDPILAWLVTNWPVILLIGCILVSLITIMDYFYTAKVFDRLEPAYAVKAVDSAASVRKRVESGGDEKEIESIRRKITSEAKAEVDALRDGPPLSTVEIMKLRPSVYINVVLDAYLQRAWKLLNPTAHALSVLQLFTVLMTAFVALFSMAIVYLAVQAGHKAAIASTVDSLTFCILAFAVYPVCYRYFVAEMQLITSFTSTIRGDIFSGLLIAVFAGVVLTLDPDRRDMMSVLFRAVPFLFVLGPSVATGLAGPIALRSIIGIDANPGARVTLLVVLLVFAAVIVLSVWPRERRPAVPPSGPTVTSH